MEQRDNPNQWHISEFPVVRQDGVCQFALFAVQEAPNNGYDSTDKQQQHRNREEESHNLYLLATSPILHLSQAETRPTAVHWALTQDASTMLVTFITGQAGTPMIQYQVVVDDDDNNNNNNNSHFQTATGTSDTYHPQDLCSSPANATEPGKFQDPGRIHTIRVTHLTPDTLYEYRVGVVRASRDMLPDMWSRRWRIRSPLPTGSDSNFSYIVYGDQGCPSDGWGPGGTWVNAMVAREITHHQTTTTTTTTTTSGNSSSFGPVRAVHHFGDLSYARGAAHIWDEWFHMIESFTTRVPLMISIGNHEYDYQTMHAPGLDPSFTGHSSNADHRFVPRWGNMDLAAGGSGGECGVVVAKHFSMPSTTGANESMPASNGVFWYSFDMGSVHTTVLSGEHNLSPGSPQHTWLEADLMAATANREKTPWLVVEVHRPMYNSQMLWDQNDVGIGMRWEFEYLLHKYAVDLFLAGHYHAYLRTCDGLFRSRCNQGGPTHITVGAAGACFHKQDLYENDWTAAFIRGVYGYGRISVANASAMHFEYVKAGPEDDPSSGDVLDDVWILRDR